MYIKDLSSLFWTTIYRSLPKMVKLPGEPGWLSALQLVILIDWIKRIKKKR
ncbi:MAG: hypothetical protein KAS07_03455 [Candidatus Pacebacteria bacterium]|nr:hypothetical protein [Candidatus Paceibacterota bacterium]